MSNEKVHFQMKATKPGFPDGINKRWYKKGEVYTVETPGGRNIASLFISEGTAIRITQEQLDSGSHLKEFEDDEHSEAPAPAAPAAKPGDGDQEAEEATGDEPEAPSEDAGPLTGNAPRAGRRRTT